MSFLRRRILFGDPRCHSCTAEFVPASADTASVLDSHLAGDVPPFATDAGLAAPGSKVFAKVFVVLTTGNKKGSRTVIVVSV